MRLRFIYVFLLLIVLISFASVDAKKKKKKLGISFKKHRRHHNAAAAVATVATVAATSTTPTYEAPKTSAIESIESKVSEKESERIYTMTPTTQIKAEIQSYKAETTHTATATKRTNLRLVYKSLIPPGKTRPKDNLVFQYTDNEEGKTCRCICRVK